MLITYFRYTLVNIKTGVLEPVEGEEARQRQEATQLVGKGIKKQDVNGASESDAPLGRTDERIAKIAGVSPNGTENEEAEKI